MQKLKAQNAWPLNIGSLSTVVQVVHCTRALHLRGHLLHSRPRNLFIATIFGQMSGRDQVLTKLAYYNFKLMELFPNLHKGGVRMVF